MSRTYRPHQQKHPRYVRARVKCVAAFICMDAIRFWFDTSCLFQFIPCVRACSHSSLSFSSLASALNPTAPSMPLSLKLSEARSRELICNCSVADIRANRRQCPLQSYSREIAPVSQAIESKMHRSTLLHSPPTHRRRRCCRYLRWTALRLATQLHHTRQACPSTLRFELLAHACSLACSFWFW